MDYLYHMVIIALIYALFAQSLNLELGFTGSTISDTLRFSAWGPMYPPCWH